MDSIDEMAQAIFEERKKRSMHRILGLGALAAGTTIAQAGMDENGAWYALGAVFVVSLGTAAKLLSNYGYEVNLYRDDPQRYVDLYGQKSF